MANGQGIADVLGRVRRFEEELRSMGVSVKVSVRRLNADGHEYGSHEADVCAGCASYAMGFEVGRREGDREQTERPDGSLNGTLDRS